MGRSIAPSRAPFDLVGRLALVTGASAGIGEAIAERLAGAGCGLVLVARREERLKRLADRLASEHDVAVHVAVLDIAERAAVDAWARREAGLLERVEVLVNNAGLARGVDLVQDGDPDDWETMFATNVLALLYFTRLVLPHMIRRGGGDIVNLGSTAGRWVYRGGAVYAATKHAVRAISEGLRMDVHGTGIRVMNIEPGLVETEFSIVRLQDEERAAQVYADTVPLVAADIADIVHHGLTLPRHVNIQELVVFPTDQAAVGMVHRRREGDR